MLQPRKSEFISERRYWPENRSTVALGVLLGATSELVLMHGWRIARSVIFIPVLTFHFGWNDRERILYDEWTQRTSNPVEQRYDDGIERAETVFAKSLKIGVLLVHSFLARMILFWYRAKRLSQGAYPTIFPPSCGLIAMKSMRLFWRDCLFYPYPRIRVGFQFLSFSKKKTVCMFS